MVRRSRPDGPFQLAFSLGEVNAEPARIAALAAIATEDADSLWIRTAVLSSIAGRSAGPSGRAGPEARISCHGRGAESGSMSWRSWRDRSKRSGPFTPSFWIAVATPRLGSQRLMRAATLAVARGRQRAGGSIREVLERDEIETAVTSLLADAATDRRVGRSGRRPIGRDPAARSGRRQDRPRFVARAAGRPAARGRSTRGLAGAWRVSSIARLANEIVGALEVNEPGGPPRRLSRFFSVGREGSRPCCGPRIERDSSPSELDPARLTAVAGASGPVDSGPSREGPGRGSIGVARPKPGHRVLPTGDPARGRSRRRARGLRQDLRHLPSGRGRGRRRRSQPGDGREPVARGSAHPHPRSEPRGRPQLRELQRRARRMAASCRESSPMNRPARSH